MHVYAEGSLTVSKGLAYSQLSMYRMVLFLSSTTPIIVGTLGIPGLHPLIDSCSSHSQADGQTCSQEKCQELSVCQVCSLLLSHMAGGGEEGCIAHDCFSLFPSSSDSIQIKNRFPGHLLQAVPDSAIHPPPPL